MFSAIETAEDFNTALSVSNTKPILIFKHSTRCPISSMAKNRIETKAPELSQAFEMYIIDVIQNRTTSLEFASQVGVQHESPQVLIFKGEKAVYHNSHNGINAAELLELV